MVEFPFNPVDWGIDVHTARELEGFSGPALPRVMKGRITEVAPPQVVEERVGSIARLARAADQGGWYWETRAPHPACRRVDDLAASRGKVNAWTAEDDTAFAENWPEELDRFVDQYIELYRSSWTAAVSVLHEDSNPIHRYVRDLLKSGKIVPARVKGYTQEQLTDYKLSNALDAGPFNVTVARRRWEFPTVRTCACCGALHYFDLARYFLIRQFGAPGLCAPCMSGAKFGLESTGLSRIEVLEAMRSFSDSTHTIPTTNFREQVYTPGLSDVDRGVAVAQLLAIPTIDEVLRITGCSTWLAVLQAAGIVTPAGWRPSHGTMCLAKDGHFCRSLAEQAICDWLYAYAVEHVVEPRWPRHPELNPSGRMRADWAIGELYVEFAGMMTKPEYRQKMGRKERLAEISGIELLVIEPEHLPRLKETFGSALGIDFTEYL